MFNTQKHNGEAICLNHSALFYLVPKENRSKSNVNYVNTLLSSTTLRYIFDQFNEHDDNWGCGSSAQRRDYPFLSSAKKYLQKKEKIQPENYGYAFLGPSNNPERALVVTQFYILWYDKKNKDNDPQWTHREWKKFDVEKKIDGAFIQLLINDYKVWRAGMDNEKTLNYYVHELLKEFAILHNPSPLSFDGEHPITRDKRKHEYYQILWDFQSQSEKNLHASRFAFLCKFCEKLALGDEEWNEGVERFYKRKSNAFSLNKCAVSMQDQSAKIKLTLVKDLLDLFYSDGVDEFTKDLNQMLEKFAVKEMGIINSDEYKLIREMTQFRQGKKVEKFKECKEKWGKLNKGNEFDSVVLRDSAALN